LDDKTIDLNRITQQRDGILRWLDENHPECFSEQKHLTENTQERVYWHYGYVVALRDVLRFLTGETLTGNPESGMKAVKSTGD
jgi:hypothetical protein